MRIIQGKKSRDVYYYDEENMTLSDKEGNIIKIYENLEGISDNNLRIYLDDLFHDFYKMINEFKIECQVDKVDKIEWSDFK